MIQIVPALVGNPVPGIEPKDPVDALFKARINQGDLRQVDPYEGLEASLIAIVMSGVLRTAQSGK